MKLFVTYEETPWNAQGEMLVLDSDGMGRLYREEVNKEEYPTCEEWLYDMLKSGIFEEITNTFKVWGKNKKYYVEGGEKLIDYFKTEEQAENFCESWGWSYSDDTGDYWLEIETA